MDFSIVEVKQAYDELGSSPDGLSKSEADRLILERGLNQISSRPQKSFFNKLIEPFRSLFVVILIVAGLLSALSGEALEAIAIGVIVAVNAIIYYIQEYSAQKVLISLRRSDARRVRCRRDGKLIEIATEQLVPGDIIVLTEGDKVPADARLIEQSSLSVDESMLTGESEPVEKSADTLARPEAIYERSNILFAGTLIQSGTAEALVVTTADETELGKIAALSVEEAELSPLQHKINKLTNKIIMAVSGFVVIAFVLALYRGIALDEAIRFVLSLAVSAIPESLPVALTLVLLFGVRRMAARKALVRNLSAVEILGQVQLVATDKTGTITHNKLQLAKLVPFSDEKTLKQSIRMSLSEDDHSSREPLETTLRESIHASLPSGAKHTQTIPFDQDLRLSGAVYKINHKSTIHLKGAPESILDICELKASAKAKLKKTQHELSEHGFRVIAVAHKSGNSGDELTRANRRGFSFDGFVALADPMRAQIPSAVNAAHNAGIDVILLTGDHEKTAAAIGRQAGIIVAESQVEDGSILVKLTPTQIRERVKRTKVFSRILPEYKYAILDAYSGRLTTAMTGDGVNDVPAIVKADVGIAVGRGTDAAKEAADMILLDNNFATIIEAIRQGRTILANVRKMIMYLFATNLGEVITMIGALVIGLPLPVTALQILWINLVTDGFTVIPLGLEPPEQDQMRERPTPKDQPLLSRPQLIRVITTSCVMAILTILVFIHYRRIDPVLASTMAFCTLVVVQWANAINMRSEYDSFLVGWRRPNWVLYGGLLAAFIAQSLAIFGPLAHVFGTERIAISDGAILIWAIAIVLVAGDLLKVLTKSDIKRLNP